MASPAWPPPTTKVFIFSDIIRILTASRGTLAGRNLSSNSFRSDPASEVAWNSIAGRASRIERADHVGVHLRLVHLPQGCQARDRTFLRPVHSEIRDWPRHLVDELEAGGAYGPCFSACFEASAHRGDQP